MQDTTTKALARIELQARIARLEIHQANALAAVTRTPASATYRTAKRSAMIRGGSLLGRYVRALRRHSRLLTAARAALAALDAC